MWGVGAGPVSAPDKEISFLKLCQHQVGKGNGHAVSPENASKTALVTAQAEPA